MTIFRTIGRWFGAGDEDEGGTKTVSCEEALQLLHDFLDGELDYLTHDAVEEHFRVCACCYPHLATEKSFRARVKKALSDREVPDGLRSRVMAILDEEKRSASDDA